MPSHSSSPAAQPPLSSFLRVVQLSTAFGNVSDRNNVLPTKVIIYSRYHCAGVLQARSMRYSPLQPLGAPCSPSSYTLRPFSRSSYDLFVAANLSTVPPASHIGFVVTLHSPVMDSPFTPRRGQCIDPACRAGPLPPCAGWTVLVNGVSRWVCHLSSSAVLFSHHCSLRPLLTQKSLVAHATIPGSRTTSSRTSMIPSMGHALRRCAGVPASHTLAAVFAR